MPSVQHVVGRRREGYLMQLGGVGAFQRRNLRLKLVALLLHRLQLITLLLQTGALLCLYQREKPTTQLAGT